MKYVYWRIKGAEYISTPGANWVYNKFNKDGWYKHNNLYYWHCESIDFWEKSLKDGDISELKIFDDLSDFFIEFL